MANRNQNQLPQSIKTGVRQTEEKLEKVTANMEKLLNDLKGDLIRLGYRKQHGGGGGVPVSIPDSKLESVVKQPQDNTKPVNIAAHNVSAQHNLNMTKTDTQTDNKIAPGSDISSTKTSSTNQMGVKKPVNQTPSVIKNQPNKPVVKPTLTSIQRSSINKITPTYKRSTIKPHVPGQIMRPRTPIRPRCPTLREMKDFVDQAIRNKKTFTVCGNYPSIRQSLEKRGWIERIKLHPNDLNRENMRYLSSLTYDELLRGIPNKENGEDYRKMLMSKLLMNHQVDFYWDYFSDPFKENPDNVKYTIINRFRPGHISGYTSKRGLCESLKSSHWYYKPGVANILHPRTYCLGDVDGVKDFVQDFKLTATMALLKWVVHTASDSVVKVISESGKIPLSCFDFALNQCADYIRYRLHEDIDQDISQATDYEWEFFLENFYKVVHVMYHFKDSPGYTTEVIVAKARDMLDNMKMYWPHLEVDGMMDMWILKPQNSSRGCGIHICRTLQYILNVIQNNTNEIYVVQKYIEKPLLIYNTKFDIRQWFLISKGSPLTIWIYKECYIRFSSQTYSLRKLHESIHLTNNSIQCRYKNANRDPFLPEQNMWDSISFQQYLENIGHPKVWDEIVYPGMKQGITGAILLCQDDMDTRKNSFEIYGADFMLTEDFRPWLIEINFRPALYASTNVTARLSPEVLEDTIKVVIDLERNSKASTGKFELLYKEQIQKLNAAPKDFYLEGQALANDFFYNPPGIANSSSKPGSPKVQKRNSPKNSQNQLTECATNTNEKRKMPVQRASVKSTEETIKLTTYNESIASQPSEQMSGKSVEKVVKPLANKNEPKMVRQNSSIKNTNANESVLPKTIAQASVKQTESTNKPSTNSTLPEKPGGTVKPASPNERKTANPPPAKQAEGTVVTKTSQVEKTEKALKPSSPNERKPLQPAPVQAESTDINKTSQPDKREDAVKLANTVDKKPSQPPVKRAETKTSQPEKPAEGIVKPASPTERKTSQLPEKHTEATAITKTSQPEKPAGRAVRPESSNESKTLQQTIVKQTEVAAKPTNTNEIKNSQKPLVKETESTTNEVKTPLAKQATAQSMTKDTERTAKTSNKDMSVTKKLDQPKITTQTSSKSNTSTSKALVPFEELFSPKTSSRTVTIDKQLQTVPSEARNITIRQISMEMKDTLERLLAVVQREKQRRENIKKAAIAILDTSSQTNEDQALEYITTEKERELIVLENLRSPNPYLSYGNKESLKEMLNLIFIRRMNRRTSPIKQSQPPAPNNT